LAASGSILLVPVGSTEQHGPHLPVTTDTDIAVAVASGAAGAGRRLAVAPPVAYGASGEHQSFGGTLSIGQDATRHLLVELVRSATIHFAGVVLVSTHGGNATSVRQAEDLLRSEGRRVLAWSPSWPGDLHAGRTETSLMLAIAPGRVHAERAETGDGRPLRDLLPLLRSGGVGSVSANGILGDPTGASADEGRALLATAVDDLVGAANRLKSGTSTEVDACDG
jgi:creatinine amidohydrolase